MLYIDGAIPAKTMEEWVLPDGFTKHKVAIDRLVQLRLFSEKKYVISLKYFYFIFQYWLLETEKNAKSPKISRL